MGLKEIVHVRCLVWHIAQSKQQGMEAKSLIKRIQKIYTFIYVLQKY